MEVLTHSANMWFSIALLIMALLALIDGLSLLVGFGLSDVLDNILPDLDVPDGPDSLGPVTGLLNWLHVGQVPALIIFVLFLFCFGAVGLSVQLLMDAIAGFYLPTLVAVPIAVFLAAPPVRFFAGIVGRVIGNDQTDAISRAGFVGQIATITIGEAKKGYAAEAKFKDEFGTTHYVMVEPANEGDAFKQGDSVLITGPESSDATVFFVVDFERPNVI